MTSLLAALGGEAISLKSYRMNIYLVNIYPITNILRTYNFAITALAISTVEAAPFSTTSALPRILLMS